jgi:hypothetical protein
VSAPLPQGAAWYNLLDARDPIAFAAEQVFSNVRDVQVRLAEQDFAAVHSAYFADPRFYDALGQIFAERFGARIESDASAFFGLSTPFGVERE